MAGVKALPISEHVPRSAARVSLLKSICLILMAIFMAGEWKLSILKSFVMKNILKILMTSSSKCEKMNNWRANACVT